MKRLIIFLVRKKLGLKKGEHFRFVNQSSPYNTYYFTDDAVMKHFSHWKGSDDVKSSVSLNWLLHDECEIMKVEDVKWMRILGCD